MKKAPRQSCRQCKRPVHCKGLCASHYAVARLQWRIQNVPGALEKRRVIEVMASRRRRQLGIAYVLPKSVNRAKAKAGRDRAADWYVRHAYRLPLNTPKNIVSGYRACLLARRQLLSTKREVKLHEHR